MSDTPALPPTADEPDDSRGPRGIQSIEVGGSLLKALAHHGRPLALKDLAREAGMPPAKAHPYLVSFQKVGLVAQEAGNGRYGLGPLALQMGLIGLQQYDPVRLATPVIEQLAETTGLTVAMAVWGNRGPTLVRIAEAPTPVHVAMRHGTVMSLNDTATGRLFAAWLPPEQVARARAAEAGTASLVGTPAGDPDAEELARIRTQGLSQVAGRAVPGVNALAAPVLAADGRLALALTAIGPGEAVDWSLSGATAQALREAARGVSVSLGWRG